MTHGSNDSLSALIYCSFTLVLAEHCFFFSSLFRKQLQNINFKILKNKNLLIFCTDKLILGYSPGNKKNPIIWIFLQKNGIFVGIVQG